jgi:hypothetical protein
LLVGLVLVIVLIDGTSLGSYGIIKNVNGKLNRMAATTIICGEIVTDTQGMPNNLQAYFNNAQAEDKKKIFKSWLKLNSILIG